MSIDDTPETESLLDGSIDTGLTEPQSESKGKLIGFVDKSSLLAKVGHLRIEQLPGEASLIWLKARARSIGLEQIFLGSFGAQASILVLSQNGAPSKWQIFLGTSEVMSHHHLVGEQPVRIGAGLIVICRLASATEERTLFIPTQAALTRGVVPTLDGEPINTVYTSSQLYYLPDAL